MAHKKDSYSAEDYINFIKQGRRDKISPHALEVIAKRFDELLSTLPEEKEEGWIERYHKLPEVDGRYLVIYHNEVHIEVWLNRLGEFDSFCNDLITHWMPLPEFNPSK
jgi:hypothetical protein